jgi:hypothetical protein
VDTKELVRFGFDQTEWMHALKLLSSKSIVVLSLTICWPHAPCSLLQLERCLSFTKSIDVTSWNLHINLYELILEKESLIRRIDQSFARSSTLEPEIKWIRFEVKFDHFKMVQQITSLFGCEIIGNIEASAV